MHFFYTATPTTHINFIFKFFFFCLFSRKPNEDGSRFAKISLGLNITCTVLGIITYIIISIVIPVLSYNHYYNNYYYGYSSSTSTNYATYYDCNYAYSYGYYSCSNYHTGCTYVYAYDGYQGYTRYFYKCS